MLETAAKKIKIVRPGDNVMVTVPDMDRAKIHAQSLHAVYENLEKKKTFIFTALVTFFFNSIKIEISCGVCQANH